MVPVFRALGQSAHIALELAHAYWFKEHLSSEETRHIEEHIKRCDGCRQNIDRYRDRFPDRKCPWAEHRERGEL